MSMQKETETDNLGEMSVESRGLFDPEKRQRKTRVVYAVHNIEHLIDFEAYADPFSDPLEHLKRAREVAREIRAHYSEMLKQISIRINEEIEINRPLRNHTENNKK